jgi:GH43 family beta-xylosidase
MRLSATQGIHTIYHAAWSIALLGGCEFGAPSPPTSTPSDAREVTPESPPQRGTFRNPLNSGADPFMTYDGGSYYLATTQGDAVRMWKATSLAELAVAMPTTIWQDTDPSRNRDVWAPAFYRFGDRWYVYYTADDGVDDHHRIYALESAGTDPLGPYHWKAKLEPPGATNLWAIDPVVLEQASGRYLVWSGAGTEGHNLLYIAPMSDPWTLSGGRVYLAAPGGCSEVREAPAILQHDATTFLVYSTCDTGKPDYQLWRMSIPTAADPMVAANWTRHTTAMFARNDAAGIWGPGSNGFFKSPDGTEDWIVYHAKNTDQFTYDFRTTRAQRITWVDGSPQLGPPAAAGATLDLPSADPGRSPEVIDDDSVTFSDGWTRFPSCGVQCYLGGDHGSSTPGATATFTFTGTQIALFSVRDSGNGVAAFSIDGGPETTRDYYAAIRQGEQAVYTSPVLPHGPHQLRVRVTGNHAAASVGAAISIDRAEVFGR